MQSLQILQKEVFIYTDDNLEVGWSLLCSTWHFIGDNQQRSAECLIYSYIFMIYS